jgi:hypothetical protein
MLLPFQSCMLTSAAWNVHVQCDSMWYTVDCMYGRGRPTRFWRRTNYGTHFDTGQSFIQFWFVVYSLKKKELTKNSALFVSCPSKCSQCLTEAAYAHNSYCCSIADVADQCIADILLSFVCMGIGMTRRVDSPLAVCRNSLVCLHMSRMNLVWMTWEVQVGHCVLLVCQ